VPAAAANPVDKLARGSSMATKTSGKGSILQMLESIASGGAPGHAMPMADEAPLLTHGQLVWLLGSLCSRYRIPFDPDLLVQRFPPPCTLASVHAAARALGLRTGECATETVTWAEMTFPVIVFSSAQDGASALPRLVLAVEGEQLVLCNAGSATPERLPVAEAGRLLSGRILLVAPVDEAADAADSEDLPDEPRRFGFRWFVPELMKHRGIWRDVLLASLAIQLVALATPVFTQVIIDKVVVHQTQSTLVVIATALFMFLVFTGGMTWMRQWLVLHTGNRVDAVLGSHVFSHLLRLPMPYFEQRPTGTLVARLQGVETIREFVTGAAVSLLLDLPFLLIFVAVMFVYSWQLSLIALAFVGLVVLVSAAITPILRARLQREFMLGARNQALTVEYLSGIATVKALQMEGQVERRYADVLAGYLAAGFDTRRTGNTYSVLAQAIEQAMALSLLVMGALLVMRNDGFTIGMLVAFQMFASRMSQPLLRLVGLWHEFQQASIAVRRLGDIMDVAEEPHALVPSREGPGRGDIEFVQLGFRYTSGHPWLFRNLNLRLKSGHLTVLMGPSGSGKSTLSKLLLGFYLAEEGAIRVDGRDIRHLAANELRALFGVVPQETQLFAGTVYENVVVTRQHASFEEVVQACKEAEIHEVIEQLPKGYQTELGEQGIGLSGGQRQRIAIARALLKRPRFLLFDEATAHLDAPTAESFARTINRLKGRMTVLLIAHQVPKGLAVDELVSLRPQSATRMELASRGYREQSA
jgi:ATP-binding cassette, subfamily B, bacterial HlyB/CyaB